MEIRPTTTDDLEEVMKIYEHARAFMREHDNPRQWSAYGWPPQSVIDATNAYYHDSDKIGQFAEDCLIADPNAETKTSALYDAYRTWCSQNGCYAENNRNFIAELRKFEQGQVIRKRPKTGGEKTTVFVGYSLRGAVEFLR